MANPSGTVHDVHRSGHPGLAYQVLIGAGILVVFGAILASGFVDLGTYHPGARWTQLLIKLQGANARMIGIPLSRNPWGFGVLALGLAYAVAGYGFLVNRLSNAHRRFHALTTAPFAATVAGSGFFVVGGLLDLQRTDLQLWTWAASGALLGILISNTYAYTALDRGPRTVKDIARAPSAYDLEDLSGAARADELADLCITSETWPTSPPPGRLVLGRLHEESRPTNRWVAPHHDRLQQTLVVAPPGAGKTFSIALPWSRELPRMDQSVFCIDIKGNMRQKLAPEARASRVQILTFDPTAPEASVHWNPFDEIRRDDPVDLRTGRDRLAEAIFGEVSRGENAYFDLRDLRFIKAGIEVLLYLHDAPTLHDLQQLFLSQQSLAAAFTTLREKARSLTTKGLLTPQEAAFIASVEADLSALYKKSEQKDMSFSELIQGVRNKLEPFAHPALTRLTDASYIPAPRQGGKGKPGPGFSLSAITTRPSIFLCTTPMKLGLLGSSIAAVMVRMVQHIMTHRFATADPHKRLFLILDEFSKLRLNAKQVEDFISTSREAACVSVVILQDITQIVDEIRLSILSNCRDVYVLRGAGPATAQWFSTALDQRRRFTSSVSENESESLRHTSAALSASVSEHWVPVLRPREIRNTGNLRYGAWVLLDSYSPKPILVNLERPAS